MCSVFTIEAFRAWGLGFVSVHLDFDFGGLQNRTFRLVMFVSAVELQGRIHEILSVVPVAAVRFRKHSFACA